MVKGHRHSIRKVTCGGRVSRHKQSDRRETRLWWVADKRHILVDTLGLLLQVVVGAANLALKAGAKLLLGKIKGQFPRL